MRISIMGVLISDCDPHSVVIIHKRPNSPEGDCWDLPGGGPQDRQSGEGGREETLTEILVREVEEETGLKSSQYHIVRPLTVSENIFPDYERDGTRGLIGLSLIYLCSVRGKPPLRPEDPEREAKWLPTTELKKPVIRLSSRSLVAFEKAGLKKPIELMVILDRHVAVDGVRLTIAGVSVRDVIHQFGVPHGAVQVVPVVLKDSKPWILLHKRPPEKKVDPDKWDVCGGHIEVTGDLLARTTNWNDFEMIQRLFDETAIREINEELQITNCNFEFGRQHLKCFGQLGVFEVGFVDASAINREHSACYVAFIPKETLHLSQDGPLEQTFVVKDTVEREGRTAEVRIKDLKLIPLAVLINDFKKDPGQYADGVSRLLSRLVKEPGARREFADLLEEHYR